MKRLILLFCLSSFFSVAQADEVVKLSKSGLCHDQSSRYYPTIKHFQQFSSMQACIAAGGNNVSSKVPASSVNKLTSAQTTHYNRKQWRHWIDADHDCQNTRAEVLIRDAIKVDEFKTSAQCLVVRGHWLDKYSGSLLLEASDLDIDHIIPLAYAHNMLEESWSSDKKRDFANDSENLIAVSASLNRQKGAKGPAQWMPPAKDYQCQYLRAWQRISAKYDLPIQLEDSKHINSQLSSSHCQNLNSGNLIRAAN